MSISHSVVITCYNKSHSIRLSIESVLNQLSDAFELVIIDDCSSDDSLKIIQDYENVAKIVCNSENLGVLRSTIKAVQNCNGDFITLLDGDDFLVPGSIFLINQFLKNNPNSILYTKCKRIRSDQLIEHSNSCFDIVVEKYIDNKNFVRKNMSGSVSFSFPKNAVIDNIEIFPKIFIQDHILPIIFAFKIENFFFSNTVTHLAIDWENSDHLSRNFPQMNHDSIEVYWFRVRYELCLGNFYNALVAKLQLCRLLNCIDKIFGLKIKMKYLNKLRFLFGSQYAYRNKVLTQKLLREKYHIKYFGDDYY